MKRLFLILTIVLVLNTGCSILSPKRTNKRTQNVIAGRDATVVSFEESSGISIKSFLFLSGILILGWVGTMRDRRVKERILSNVIESVQAAREALGPNSSSRHSVDLELQVGQTKETRNFVKKYKERKRKIKK